MAWLKQLAEKLAALKGHSFQPPGLSFELLHTLSCLRNLRNKT
jgi:hypothetical protein